MAPANQPSSKVSAIDARMTPSGSGSVAPAVKIAKKKIAKKRTRNSDMAPANQPPFEVPGVDPQMTPSVWASLSVAQAEKIIKNRKGEIHNMCKRKDPCTVVSCNAPVNVDKWDDIPEEQIQPRVDWILWRMKLRFECIQDQARREVQNPDMMEIISKLGSSNIGD
ncbi:hypothetical protein EZV62_000196 [Acer yangbiense]|uniref:Uncharacterized protein n=1 Tax=Acer yangbiense TaxID=1000413 RepID=A0A5C7IQE6_9ROSI|nr:hypothetical protein EZV62_000196 [Acer yangbiense]